MPGSAPIVPDNTIVVDHFDDGHPSPWRDAAVGERFCDVYPRHAVRAVEIGERARDAQHPVIAARRELEAVDRLGQ